MCWSVVRRPWAWGTSLSVQSFAPEGVFAESFGDFIFTTSISMSKIRKKSNYNYRLLYYYLYYCLIINLMNGIENE